ncbi:MAG: NADH:flavin oxidoreductase [Halieaceae bacterium]|nr:NADH:flavin oxidoreductase [Halieaceae bacterium]
MSQYREKLFAPARLNGLELRNRIIRAATFEGKCPNGYPGDELIALHREVAQGGVGLTTVAYCAVEANGRVKKEMMYMHEGIRSQVEALTSAVHQAGGKVSGQMGHCGNFSQNTDFRGFRPLGPSPMINLGGIAAGLPFAGAMSHKDIDHVVQCFHDAALFMKSAGFDAVEVHFGHGYGLSQFISPRTNRRTDEYGGPLINRMRYPLRALEAVRKAVGDEFPILGKMGLTDGIKGGLTTDEAVEVAGLLDDAGIDAIIPSGGTSSMNPMLLFRGDSLLPSMLELEKSAFMRFGMRVFGKKMFRNYPYEELYFLDGARRVRDRIKRAKLCYIGGASTMQSLETVMREFDFVQMGRTLIKDPLFVKNAMADPNYVNGCDHCNKCAAMILHPEGIRCVRNDP